MISNTEYELMRLLIEERCTYGYELAKHGVKLGGIYVLLGRLEGKKLVAGEFKVNGSTRPRKHYRATEHGKDVFKLLKKLRGLACG